MASSCVMPCYKGLGVRILGILHMMDLMWGAKNVAATTFISVGPYMVAALIYFCINYPAGKIIEAIERRMRRGDK